MNAWEWLAIVATCLVLAGIFFFAGMKVGK